MGATGTIAIEDIGTVLGEVYFIEKDAKDELSKLRLDFFQAAAASFTPKELARKTVQIPEDIDADGADAYVEKYFPGYRFVSNKDRSYLIEDDPDFKPYTLVIPLDPWTVMVKDEEVEVFGYVIIKEVRSGTPQIDDARMKLADPGLYDAVTRPQGYDWIFAMLSDFSVEAREVDDMIQQRLPSDWPVELRDDLTPEEVEEIRPYTYEGKKTLALKVRYAKESEV